MIEIKQKFLESYFLRVLGIIKRNFNVYFYTIILDFIFLALIFFVGKYFGSLIPSSPQELFNLFKSSTNLLLFVFLYPIAYYLFVLSVYSITKLIILNLIKSLYEENEFTLRRFGKFYLLNIMVFALFFFSALILLGILALIFKEDFLNYVVLILLAIFLFFLYSVINISHTLFIKNEGDKIIRKSINIAFNKIDRYGMFIVWNSAVVLVYLISYNLIIRLLIFVNRDLFASYGGVYEKIFSIVSFVIIYLIIAFNRIYFYEKIDKDVLQ